MRPGWTALSTPTPPICEGLTLGRPRCPPPGYWTVCEGQRQVKTALHRPGRPACLPMKIPQRSKQPGGGGTYGSLDSGSVSMTTLAACSSSSCRAASSAALLAISSATRAASRRSCWSLYRNNKDEHQLIKGCRHRHRCEGSSWWRSCFSPGEHRLPLRAEELLALALVSK